MKYLKRFNESDSKFELLYYPAIRSEIEDILVEFRTDYDIKFVHYSTIYSKDNFQLQILPKGYPDTRGIEPMLIDGDILGDLNRVCNFIEGELDFKYSHSYYFINHDYKNTTRNIFSSEGKLVTVIQMYFVGKDTLNESFDMSSRYGSDIMDECDSLMGDIRDWTIDLKDLGFDITLDYSYSTMNLQRSTPRIELNILGSDSLFRDNGDIFQETIDTIKKMISSYGFSYGASFGRPMSRLGLTNKKYVLIIEK